MRKITVLNLSCSITQELLGQGQKTGGIKTPSQGPSFPKTQVVKTTRAGSKDEGLSGQLNSITT